jgi:hypothetical protein
VSPVGELRLAGVLFGHRMSVMCLVVSGPSPLVGLLTERSTCGGVGDSHEGPLTNQRKTRLRL